MKGLGTLAQKQGAKGVIATLWPVADASAGLFMQHFYRLRQEQGLSKAEALRQTQLTLLRGADCPAESKPASSVTGGKWLKPKRLTPSLSHLHEREGVMIADHSISAIAISSGDSGGF